MSDLQIITTKKGTTYKRKGRPKNYTARLFIRLSEEDRQIFEIITKKEGTTVGTKTRELIEKYIKENV